MKKLFALFLFVFVFYNAKGQFFTMSKTDVMISNHIDNPVKIVKKLHRAGYEIFPNEGKDTKQKSVRILKSMKHETLVICVLHSTPEIIPLNPNLGRLVMKDCFITNTEDISLKDTFMDYLFKQRKGLDLRRSFGEADYEFVRIRILYP